MPRDQVSENELLRSFVAPGSPATTAPSCAVEVLKAARAWLSDPVRWCQGSFCRDADGLPTLNGHNQNTPVATCAWGALFIPRNVELLGDRLGADAEDFLKETMGCIPYMNDDPNTTHSDILAAYDRAITAAGG